MVVERDLPRRTAVQQVANIYRDKGSIRAALDAAFDVEPVTKAFFVEYKRLYDHALTLVTGFDGPEGEDTRLFVQTLFNRLMFVYFLSRKGWLSMHGDKDYLNALWRDYQSMSDQDNFYNDRLRRLFFFGLNNPQSSDLNFKGRLMESFIGDVPFLNGGLFEETELDKRNGVAVPDSLIDQILTDLFDRFNFTVMESTPFDIEVAVDPEMLGKVFEELVTGRNESGSYYTPRHVVSFMCREALKGYLQGQDTGLTAEAVTSFVDERDISGIGLAAARKVSEALDEVTVVDPACGSGAYLLGMMQELVDLQTLLYSDKLKDDARDLYDLKMHIIQRNLYGVDIDDFAVNIAMLRMWLSLAIDFEGDHPPALPNLDFKVVCGDSLLGPDPGPENYGDLFRHHVHRVADRLADLKARYMAATTGKDTLREEIKSVEDDLTAALADSPAPEGAVDWRVQFAEVFDHGGFDVAIANPPYVNVFRIDNERPGYRQILKGIYPTAQGRFDLFVPFMERGIRLLTRSGLFAFITPNKYLGAQYATRLRRFIADNTTLKSLSDLSRFPVFSASVYPVITTAHRSRSSDADPQVNIFEPDSTNSNEANLILTRSVPMSLVDHLGNNWSPLIEEHTTELIAALKTKYRLSDLADVVPAAWVNEAYDLKDALVDEAYGLTQSQPAKFVPFIVSGNIRRHVHTWIDHSVRYMKKTYRTPALNLEHSAVSDKRRLQIQTPKIITSGMAQRPTCVWDPDGIAAGVSTTYVFPREGISGAYLAGLLNAQLMGQIYRVLFGSLSLSGGYLQIGAPQLKAIPMPDASSAIQNGIADLVNSIIAAKAADSGADTSEQETEIDELVYELYGLTKEERTAVEP